MRLPIALIFAAAAFVPAGFPAQSQADLAVSASKDGRSQLPYAIDRFNGQLELVPVHQSVVKHTELGEKRGTSSLGLSSDTNNEVGELDGSHARTILHDATPAFYIHLGPASHGSPNFSAEAGCTFAIVQAFAARHRRVFAEVQSAELHREPKHIIGQIASATQLLPDGWVKITPKTPLAPGEYTLNPVPASRGAYSSFVFDFSIDPEAPNARDVVNPPEADQSAQ